MKRKTSKKTYITLLFILFFLICSILFICPNRDNTYHKSNYNSNELKKHSSIQNDIKRTDYINSDGLITVAADLGYATMIISKDNGGWIERYYDDYGKPIKKYNGYYAIFREYDDEGNNIHNTYLDIDDNPYVTLNGYAQEKREYNKNKQLVLITYYDAAGNPVLSPYYGYGKMYDYDENGDISKITYIDINGNPMITGQGYASLSKETYYKEGLDSTKEERELYYDDKGLPIALSLGQYGIYKVFNSLGQDYLLTYLDAFGNPIATNKGYTTVKRTFNKDNTVATERYYDKNGNPFLLSEGQYGVSKEDGMTTYLDKNGRKIFNLRNLLYNHSWIVIVLSVAIIILSGLVSKQWNTLFLFLYIFIIVYLTLMFRDNTIKTKPGFLWYYSKIIIDNNARADIIKNIWLFIPMGAILYKLYPQYIILLVPMALSIVIEIIQYSMGIGFGEYDDVISNMFGGFIGYMMENWFSSFVEYIRCYIKGNTKKI